VRKPWFLLFVLLAFVAAACGSDDGDTEAADRRADDDETEEVEESVEDDEEVEAEAVNVATPAFLRSAATKTTEAGTGKMEMTVEIGGIPGAAGPVQLTAVGAYDLDNQLAQFTMDMSKLFEAVGSGSPEERAQFEQVFGDGSFEIVTQGTTVFMKMPFLAQLFGSDAEWISFDASAAAGGAQSAVPGLGSVGTGSPAAMLDSLRGASDDIEKVGSADVRGVKSVHLRGTLDMQKAIEAAPEGQRQQIEQALSQFGTAGQALPFDVFVDGDGLVRRFSMDLSGVAGAATAGATGSMTIDFFDFGAPVQIVLPPAADVFDATEQMSSLAGSGAQG
jgi:hypothetical protein